MNADPKYLAHFIDTAHINIMCTWAHDQAFKGM